MAYRYVCEWAGQWLDGWCEQLPVVEYRWTWAKSRPNSAAFLAVPLFLNEYVSMTVLCAWHCIYSAYIDVKPLRTASSSLTLLYAAALSWFELRYQTEIVTKTILV